MVEHNVPLTVADHLSPIVRDIFDGDVAKKYAYASTKITCIISGALDTYFKASLLETMKNEPYPVTVNGSNDNGLKK